MCIGLIFNDDDDDGSREGIELGFDFRFLRKHDERKLTGVVNGFPLKRELIFNLFA